MRYCSETRAIQSHIIMPSQLNGNQSLYGGQMMMWLDETAGISAARIARNGVATASIDNFNFIIPMEQDHSICIETFVSGIGKRSMEVFCKVVGENLRTGERYIAATGFMTWVTLGETIPITKIIPKTEEEILICSGYQTRRAHLAKFRQENRTFTDQLDKSLPWA